MSRSGLRTATSKVVTVDDINRELLQGAAGIELHIGDSIVIEAEVNCCSPRAAPSSTRSS